MPFDKNMRNESKNKLKMLWKQACTKFAKIHLVDKCLLMLMIVLLAQSAYVLLNNGAKSDQAHPIDIIVRTASASIFGYFLSANFVQRESTMKDSNVAVTLPTELSEENASHNIKPSTPPENRIGFALEKKDGELEAANAKVTEAALDNDKVSGVARLQIITTAAIAMFCLIVLILVRDTTGAAEPFNAAATAVASQFRDFISGCVGFLIGCPTAKTSAK